MLSLVMVFAPAISANAASSWSITSAVSAGSRSIVSATKGGYKSAVNIAPTAAKLGGRLAKGANYAALGYAVFQILSDKVTWVMDEKNNRIIYTEKPTAPSIWYYYNGTQYYTGTMDSVCNQVLAFLAKQNLKPPLSSSPMVRPLALHAMVIILLVLIMALLLL